MEILGKTSNTRSTIATPWPVKGSFENLGETEG